MNPTQVEVTISRILRAGVIVSLALVVAGMVTALFQAGGTDLDALLGPDAVVPRTLGEVLSGAAHLQPAGLVSLGLLVLIATPVVRVVASVVGFARDGDRAYTVITAVVLGLLGMSFLLGAA